jgi:hypothetical protein
MIGIVYGIPPQPPVAANTRYLTAGVLTIGVEYRDLDPASLRATYAGNPEHLAELEATSPVGGFSDEGVSIHVCATDDGPEDVRFDVFDDEPHYHYVHRTAPGDAVVNNIVAFDVAAHGEMLPWVIGCLRHRLPAMLTQAGGGHLAEDIDASSLSSVVDQVAELAERAQRAGRAARAASI